MRALAFILFIAAFTAALADETPSPFLAQFQKSFAALDASHNDTIELTETIKAIASPNVKAEAAVTAVAIRRGLRAAGLESITLNDAKNAVKKHLADKSSQPDFEGLFAWASKRLETANRKLYADDTPKIETLKQGKLGDCFCLAALRTVLHREPTAITRMIKPQTDGSYKVRIGMDEIPTPALTDGEIIVGASTANGLWPLVYEKAVGISRIKPGSKDTTPFNEVTKGGSAGTMMGRLTTHEVKRWSCKTWRSAAPDKSKQDALLGELREEFASAVREKRLMTGGTFKLAKNKKGVPGITYNHAYAVLGYDPAKDEVCLWNPHNDAFTPKGDQGIEHGYPKAHGEMHVPLTELVTFFGGFGFEQLPLSGHPQP
jgi:hypothetical protein